MKVSKNVGIDLQLLNRVLKATKNFNEAVEEGLELRNPIEGRGGLTGYETRAR